MDIGIELTHKNASIPQQATKLAGGWDVRVTEIIKEADDFVICKLGFKLKSPRHIKLTLVPRSSITKTNWILQNSPGLGDPDFTGEYQYRFRALPVGGTVNSRGAVTLTYPDFPYKIGERIGQVYLEEIIPIEWDLVESITETERNSDGFGTTGNR